MYASYLKKLVTVRASKLWFFKHEIRWRKGGSSFFPTVRLEASLGLEASGASLGLSFLVCKAGVVMPYFRVCCKHISLALLLLFQSSVDQVSPTICFLNKLIKCMGKKKPSRHIIGTE